MELTNEFTVDVPVEEAWRVLTDLERIAPCMPGAALEEVEGDEYRGVVKVKVGPVTAQYRGKASFVERDPTGHKAVLKAEGRETRGQGNASATITAMLEPSGTATRVSVVTELSITGRVAQMGRGVLADVSTKLLGQFVQSLESTVLAGSSPGAGPTGAVSEEQPAPDAAPGAPRRKRVAKRVAAAPREQGATAPVESGAATPPTEPGAAAPSLAPEPRAVSTEPAVGTVSQRAAEGNGSEPDTPEGGVRRIAPGREVAPVDLLDLAGPSVAVRVVAPVAVIVLLLALLRRRRRRRRSG